MEGGASGRGEGVEGCASGRGLVGGEREWRCALVGGERVEGCVSGRGEGGVC